MRVTWYEAIHRAEAAMSSSGGKRNLDRLFEESLFYLEQA